MPQISDDDLDLDDLDDIVNEFDSVPVKTQVSVPAVPQNDVPTDPTPTAPPPTTTSQPTAPTAPLPDWLSSDFTESFERELIKGMESLLHEISGSPSQQQEIQSDSGGDPSNESETEDQKAARRQLRAAWEAMLIQELGGEPNELGLADTIGGTGSSGPGPGPATKDTPAPAFQSTIQQTMEKLKESESHLQNGPTAASIPEPPSDEDIASLEALLAQLGGGGSDGLPGLESEEDIQKFLEIMMTQLLKKDVLYDPLKELQTKFPDYLKQNASTLSEPDKIRYESQLNYISQITAIYEDSSHNESDVDSSAKIASLLIQVQSLGSPPAEIMGPMPPGLTPGPDGMPQLPESCVMA